MLYAALLLLSISNQALTYTCTPVIVSALTAFTLIQIDVSTNAPDSTAVAFTYKQDAAIHYITSSVSSGKVTFKIYLANDGLWDLAYSCGGSTASNSISVGKLPVAFDFPIVPVDTEVFYDINVNIDLTGRTLPAELLCKLSVVDSYGQNAASQVTGSSFNCIVVNGKCSYKLKFLSVGTYNLLADLSESCTQFPILTVSTTVYIANLIKSIKATAANQTFSANTLIVLTFSIFRSNNELFTGSCLVNSNFYIGAQTLDQNSLITTTGVITQSVTLKTAGSIFLSVKATSQSDSTNTLNEIFPLEVHPLYFSIAVYTGANADPATSLDVFSISIKAVDINNIDVENTLTSVAVIISLTALSAGNSGLVIFDGSTTYNNGIFTKICQKARGILTGIKILSSGNFKLEVSSDPSQQIIAESKILNIKNYITSADLVQGGIFLFAYKFFTLTLTLIGNDGNLFLNTRAILLSGNSLIGGGIAYSSNGYVSWENVSVLVGSQYVSLIISKDPGDSHSGIVVVYVNQGKLAISFDSIIPTTSDPFTVKVIFTDQSDNLITHHSPILINIQLYDPASSSVLSLLTSPVNLTNGVLNLGNLRILSSGAFKLRAEASNVNAGLTNQIDIENKPISIELVSSGIPTASNYFKMNLTYYLIGEDNNPYVLKCTIDLIDSESSLIDTKNFTQVPVNGVIIFAGVSFSTVGMRNIIATVRGTNITVTHQANITQSTLVADFTTAIPLTSSDEFSFSIKTVDINNIDVENTLTLVPVIISLTALSAGNSGLVIFDGTTTYKNGTFTKIFQKATGILAGIKILSSGHFQLNVSTDPSWQIVGTSKILNIKNYITSATQVQNNLTIYAYKFFTLNLTVVGTDGNLFLGTRTILLSGNSIIGGGVANSSNGYVSWANISVLVVSQNYPLNISKDPGDSHSGSVVILVNPGKLVASFDPIIPTTSDPFNATVIFTDQSDNPITHHSTILVNIQLYDPASSSVLSLLTPPVNLTSGVLNVANLRILSSGAFMLRAEAANVNPGLTNQTEIENKPISIELVSSGIPTASNYFRMNLTYYLIGEDNNPYVLKCTIDLTDSESSLIGTLNFTQVPVNGTFIIPDVSFSTVGIRNLTATIRGTNITVTHQANISQSVLVADFITAIPSTSSDIFSIKVRVMDSKQQINEVYYNPHMITLSLDSLNDIGVFEGLSNLSTSNTGITEFFQYKIISAGTFKLKFSSQNLESWYSPPISIKLVSAYIKYNPNQLKQARNSLFLFNVTVQELHGTPYLYGILLSLTCSNVSDVFFTKQAIHTQNSIALFNLSFLSEGYKFCTITSSNSTNLNITFNISPNQVNLDDKCFIGLTNETCYKCIPQASLLDGICSCIEFSSYNNLTNTCDCDIGLRVFNEICTECGNYFSSSEIFSYYSSDYKSIIFKFARPVRQISARDCSRALIMPESLTELKSNCNFPNLYTIQVDFTSFLSPVEAKISLNPQKIQVIDSQCTFDISKLTVIVKVIYDLPVPLSSIVGPSKISIKCNTYGLTLTSKFILPEYNYNWTIFPRFSLSSVASNKTSHTLSIPSKSFIKGSFTFELEITNSLYNTTARSSLTVEITDKETISLIITSGTSINVHSYESLILKVFFLSTCNTFSIPEYNWSDSSSVVDKKFNFTTMTNKNLQKSYLVINKGSLKPKNQYQFTVAVRLGKYSESALINVNVVSSDLIIQLSRSSGTVGIQTDFVINYLVSDPDGECKRSDIISVWSCKENGDQCLSSDDSVLKLIDNETDLVVSKNQLRNRAFYTFNIIASCQLKVNKVTSSIDIYIDKDKLGDIRIKSILDPIVSAEGITVIPSLTVFKDPKFLWNIDPPIDNLFDLSQPILFIPADTLTQGNTYKVTLSMFSRFIDNGISAYTNLPVKLEPVCEKLEITGIVEGKFRFNIVGCQNADPLNVLSFNFGYLKNSELIWLTKPTLSNPIDLLIFNQSAIGIVKVCNSFNSCKTYNASIPKTKARNLELNIMNYNAETYDPEFIPSSIIYYSNLVTSDDELNYLYESYTNFFNQTDVNDFYLDTLLDSTISLINSTYSLRKKSSNIIQGSTDSLINILKNYNKFITNDQCSKIFNVLTIMNDVREPSQVLQTLNLLSSTNMRSKPLNYILKYSTENITVFASRNQGSPLVNKTIKINNDSLVMTNIDSSKNTVYDFQYSKYSYDDQTQFSLSYNQEGSYINYNYEPYYTTQSVNITANSSLNMYIEGPFDDSVYYTCLTHDGYNWDNKGCRILSVYSTLAVIQLDYFTSYKIIERDIIKCGLGLGPLITMIILIVLCTIFGCVLRRNDKQIFDWPSDKWLWVCYPLTSIFIPQPGYRRSFIVFQLVSGQLLIITSIGVFQYYLDTVESDSSHRFYEYPIEQLIRGFVGWLAAQAINFSVFFGNVKFINDRKCHLLTLPAMIIVTIICFLGIVLMTLRYCSGWSNYWMLSYMIFMIFDLGAQLLLASLLRLCVKGNLSEGTRTSIQMNKCQEFHMNVLDNSTLKDKQSFDIDDSRFE